MLALYSAVGEVITRYEVDVAAASLVKHESITLPGNVQYAWPHPSRRYFYVTTSNRGSAAVADFNHFCAFRIDAASGALTAHGTVTLPHRAVHVCLDASGNYALNAHNLPRSGITVNRIESDGTIGPVVQQTSGLDYGIYPHQVMVTPSNRTAILVDRGNAPANGKPEDPGALRQFGFSNGELTQGATVAPNGGYGFGPRHLDFHPTQPWVYVALELQSELHMYRMSGDGLEPTAAYIRDTVADRANIDSRQRAGTLHVHPNGRFVYVANRADRSVDFAGRPVFAGGENNIAVYAIDAKNGEPTLIQRADTRSIHVRTFAIDPSGKLMVAASIKPMEVRDGNNVTTLPATLSVFRIGDDGRLDFMRKFDVAAAGKIQYWMGMVETGD